MLRKLNKLDYTTVFSLQVIILLNYLSNVCKTVVTDMLAQWCEINHVFHKDQIGFRKQRSVINSVVIVFNSGKEA